MVYVPCKSLGCEEPVLKDGFCLMCYRIQGKRNGIMRRNKKAVLEHQLHEIDELKLTAWCQKCRSKVTIVPIGPSDEGKGKWQCYLASCLNNKTWNRLRRFGTKTIMSKACETCGNKIVKKLYYDHCHKTKKYRGTLCEGCNFSLGRAKDDPRVTNNQTHYLISFSHPHIDKELSADEKLRIIEAEEELKPKPRVFKRFRPVTNTGKNHAP